MLKSELSRKDLNITEKFLLILKSIGKPCSSAEIKKVAQNHGWSLGAKRDPHPYLKSGGAVKTSDGWEHTSHSEKKLSLKGFETGSSPLTPFTQSLLKAIDEIKGEENKRFLREAVGCMQSKHFRAAIVLSWVGALWVLYEKAFANHASAFVKEAQAQGMKNFQVKNSEDISKIHKESVFLEIAEKVGLISKTERKELVGCLDRRNDAGHPNDADPGEGLVAGHIEVLIKHVFSKL